MAGTPLTFGPEERESLHRLRDLAAQHPVDMAALMKRLDNPREKRKHMKQMSDQTIFIPLAYAVTFSIEYNHPGEKTARHMSMSVNREGRVPNEHAVWMVAEELGFVGAFKDCVIWLEDLEGHGNAVNLVQIITNEPGSA